MKELNYIVPSLRDEMERMLKALSDNAGKSQDSTIKSIEAEIRNFIHVISAACENIDKAVSKQSEVLANATADFVKSSEDQRKLLASMAVTIQGVMTQGTLDIQSKFNRTHRMLQAIITESFSKVDADYQSSMKKMFMAMADNLAAITQRLMTAGVVQILPDAPIDAPKTKRKSSAQNEKATDTPAPETDTNEEAKSGRLTRKKFSPD